MASQSHLLIACVVRECLADEANKKAFLMHWSNP
jgi:hypothetical protein